VETSVLISASIATLVLVGVLFFAGLLLWRWRKEMGGGATASRNSPGLEAIYAEWMARQAGPEAATAQAQTRADQEETRTRLADAEGLLERLRREAPDGAGSELAASIAEAESELRQIRACLNRGEAAQARDRARELTLRLAGHIARIGPQR
jgi:hypothetical protein